MGIIFVAAMGSGALPGVLARSCIRSAWSTSSSPRAIEHVDRAPVGSHSGGGATADASAAARGFTTEVTRS